MAGPCTNSVQGSGASRARGDAGARDSPTTPVVHLAVFAAYAVLFAAVYLPVVLQHASLKTNGAWPPGPLFVADPIAGGAITMPLERLAASAWHHLVLPVVDPFQGYGITLLGNQSVPVFPPEVLVHLLDPGNYSLWNLVRLDLLAFGSYWLAASLGMPVAASFAVGMGASLVGIGPPNANLGMLNPVMVLPFLLVAVRYLVDPASGCRRVAFAGVASATALLLLSGFQEVLPLFGILATIFTVAMALHYKGAASLLRTLALPVAGAASGAVAGLAGILPTLSALHGSVTAHPADSYSSFAPPFWLSTLTVPFLGGGALAAGPGDAGQTVWVVGTPILVVVVVLALVLSVRRAASAPAGRTGGGDRRGAGAAFYVWPSLVLVVVGLLGFVNAGDVLQIFAVYPTKYIYLHRFLGFLWWPPWCLLLGYVITQARRLPVWAVGAAVGTGIVFDVLAQRAYRGALAGAHVAGRYAAQADRDLVVALAVVLAFGATTLLARHLAAGRVAATAVVLAAAVCYLPRNFFPATGGGAPAAYPVPPGFPAHGRYLEYDVGTVGFPVENYTVEIFGPLVPSGYARIVDALVPPADTTGRRGALFYAGPTMYYATMNAHFLGVLHDLGVNVIVSPHPLSASLGPIPACPTTGFAASVVCSLGTAPGAAGYSAPTQFFYELPWTDPLVDPVSKVVAVGSEAAARRRTVAAVHQHGDRLPSTAFVSAASLRGPVASGIFGLARTSDPEGSRISLYARSGGVAVLRDAFQPGMRAAVDGAATTVEPVDGGLWSAVRIPAGRSVVELSYVTGPDRVEILVAVAGLGALAVAWIALGLGGIRRRRRRPGSTHRDAPAWRRDLHRARPATAGGHGDGHGHGHGDGDGDGSGP